MIVVSDSLFKIASIILRYKKINITIFFIIMFSISTLSAQEYIVSIVPIGNTKTEHMNLVKSFIENYYNSRVYILDSIEIKSVFITKFDTILDVKAINTYLHSRSDSSNHKWIGVTDWQITIGNVLPKIIRGFAKDIGGCCAVVSSAKVLSEANANTNYTFVELYKKVTLHEFGHLIGLEHCINNKKCLMTYGNSFLYASNSLCERCKSKVDENALRIP